MDNWELFNLLFSINIFVICVFYRYIYIFLQVEKHDVALLVEKYHLWKKYSIPFHWLFDLELHLTILLRGIYHLVLFWEQIQWVCRFFP